MVRPQLPTCLLMLALFVGRLIGEDALPVSSLKVIEFADLDKTYVRLLKAILKEVLSGQDEDRVRAAFQAVSGHAKLQVLSMGAQRHLMTKTAQNKLQSLSGQPIAQWPKRFFKNWDSFWLHWYLQNAFYSMHRSDGELKKFSDLPQICVKMLFGC